MKNLQPNSNTGLAFFTETTSWSRIGKAENYCSYSSTGDCNQDNVGLLQTHMDRTLLSIVPTQWRTLGDLCGALTIFFKRQFDANPIEYIRYCEAQNDAMDGYSEEMFYLPLLHVPSKEILDEAGQMELMVNPSKQILSLVRVKKMYKAVHK